MKSLTVNLAEHSYPICIEQDSSNFKSLLKTHIKAKQVVVISNETVLPIFSTAISDALLDYDVRFFTLPDGEEYKTLASFLPPNALGQTAGRLRQVPGYLGKRLQPKRYVRLR